MVAAERASRRLLPEFGGNLGHEAKKSQTFWLAPSQIAGPRPAIEDATLRVIASSIRKGNIIEHEDGELYAVLTDESF